MAADSTLLTGWLARAHARGAAVIDASGAYAWSDVVCASERVAGALLAGRASLDGERVAMLVAPGVAFVACLLGILRAGGVAVVLSDLHPPPETAYLCDDAGVRTVIASADEAARVAFLAPARDVRSAESLVAGRASPRLTGMPHDDDPALQLYTSGTTGKPKGAVLTHANLAAQQRVLAAAWGWRPDDVLLHVLPLHHMHGLAIALLTAVGAGATTRMLGAFEARATWGGAPVGERLHGRAHHSREALRRARRGRRGHARARWTEGGGALRLVTSGSAALPVSIGDRWRDLGQPYPLERFGMTEIGVGTSNPLDPAGRRPGTVGLPLPTVQARVVDEELWIAGPSVFAGYHGRPEATREAFVVDGTTRWFKTGDTVARDRDGYVRILGRTSVDILKSGGYKLSALEIEEALREHPAVAEVAVVGLPDPEWGDRVVACVVARAGRERECGEDALRGFAKERLAAYKVPRRVVCLPELPRNALGKVVKPVLVRQLSDA